MGQVYDIPYSALIATLLLKNRVVTYKEIFNFDNRICSLGRDFCTYDDEDSNLYDILSVMNDSISLHSDLNLNSMVGNVSVRDILEGYATAFGSDILLNLVQYQRPMPENVVSVNKNNKVMTRVRSILFGHPCQPGKVKMGV